MSYLGATADLLRVARASLRGRVLPAVDAATRYEVAMVANAIAIASRALELGAAAQAEERRLLAAFYDAPAAGRDELRRRLCRDLRAGVITGARAHELEAMLARLVDARLAISGGDDRRSGG